MGMSKARPAYDKLAALAFAPATVNNTETSGVVIVEPWKIGRLITFLLSLATIPGATQGHAYVYGRKRSDGSFVKLKDKSNNDLEVPVAKLATGGAGSAAALFMSLDLSKVDATTYDALRFNVKNDNATALVASATYEITDIARLPSGQIDEWIDLQPD